MVVKNERPGLILAGKQADDNDMNATGQMPAALLGWSQGPFASELEFAGDRAKLSPSGSREHERHCGGRP